MSPFEVGVAARDITPPVEWIQAGRIWLWGYGIRSAACDGVYQRISARALVIRNADGSAISLVSVDLGALDPSMTQSIRDRLYQSQGIAGEYICVNVTHTHGAPVVTTIPTWQPGVDRPDPAYVRFVEDAIVGAIDEASANMQPATISFGRGATAIGYDRHFPQLGEPSCYDPTLDVIKIIDDEANVIAVAFFAACHPVCLADFNQVYADFPGVARAHIEQAVGGMALFFQGYAGICNPGGDVQDAGATLAQDVVTVLTGPMDELDGSLDAWLSTIELPFQPLPSEAARKQAKNAGGENARWADYMELLGDGIPEGLPTQLQALRLGSAPNEWYLVASSHEVTTDYADTIRAIWPYERITVIGYSNSQLSYLPSQHVLANPLCGNFPFCSNYEGGHAFVWYGHRAPLTADVDQQFVNGHIALLDFGWEYIGHATGIVAMAAWHGKLFAATSNNKLWWRKPVAEDIPWNDMGHAMDVVGMAATNGLLFCATCDDKLWQRKAYGFNLPWQHIGHATDIAAMTALNGKLFAATHDGRLWWRDPVGADIPWEHIGHAITIVGMAAARDKLIAATSDNNLHWREPVGADIPWHRFGHAEQVVGMAALDGMLFAATQAGGLWRRGV